MPADFPDSIPIFSVKKEERDAVSPDHDEAKFINGRDINAIQDEITALSRNLGDQRKGEATLSGTQITLLDGRSQVQGNVVPFPGALFSAGPDPFVVYVSPSGLIVSGTSFPTTKHIPLFSYDPVGPSITDERIFIDSVQPGVGTASGTEFAPGVPSDWDAPIPSESGSALDQLAERLNEIEHSTALLSGTSIRIHPRYPNSVESFAAGSDVSIGYDVEPAGGRRQFAGFSTTSLVPGTTKIAFKQSLAKHTGLSKVRIEVFRSGTGLDSLTLSVFKEDGTPDPAVSGLSIIPSGVEAFESIEAIPALAYDSQETISVEIAATLSSPSGTFRTGKVEFDLLP